ncbi:MAG: hypothetical protein JSU96_08235 [Acidobacteriota bacterium]|nr:MAG: hypothetical protein JSU96_08235 [Acidobacteriota bacterium]
MVVTFLTKPTPEKTLVKFYERTHPGGVGWKKIAEKVPHVKGDSGFGRLFVDWVLSVVAVYAFLFGLGSVLFGEYLSGIVILAIGAVSAVVVYLHLQQSSSD